MDACDGEIQFAERVAFSRSGQSFRAVYRGPGKNSCQYPKLAWNYIAGVSDGGGNCSCAWAVSWLEHANRQRRDLHIKISECNSADCVHSLWNSAFRSVLVFVIFLATFWPVLASTMSGVLNVEQKVIDSAKVLNVKKFTMLFSVILPAALPQIFIGLNQGLTVSFILLTSAEMIGARDGLGYYVKQYSDFGDYTRAIVGILVIGIVVIAISFLFNKLQRYLLRWKR